jgi:CsoR family transcriptional regulator, copper-sensing transcriptional repressor
MHHHLKKEDTTRRLSRIIGQLGGIQRMVEQDRDCPEILIQLASARAALGKLTLLITEDHMEHCITTSFQKGKGKESIASMSNALRQVLK